MKFRPVGDELFHTDRWTNMRKLIFVLTEFCERAKKNTDTEEYGLLAEELCT